MNTRTITLQADATTRLDTLLQSTLASLVGRDISNSKIRRLIMAGAVSVSGSPRRIPAFNVHKGSRISVVIDEAKLFYEKDAGDISYELTARDVLYEDDAIIVVNKPALFPTEAGMVESRDNLHAAVVRYLWRAVPQAPHPPYAGIMHRLDRETSGVILFTKQRAANAACHTMFESHTAQKIYYAVCCVQSTARATAAARTGAADATTRPSLVAGAHFSVDMPMARISGKSQAAKWGRAPLSQGALASHTDFTVLSVAQGKNGARYALIEARPTTGRTHQIRVHLSSVALPILGDRLYGGKTAARIHLHAHSLTFPHPLTGVEMTVTAPLSWAPALPTP